MFKIGDFSRLTRVSAKMLRHYDDIGLLKPARVDLETGYRYYSASQLPRLNRIVALKDLGFGLEQIASLLDDDLSLDELRGMMRLRQAEIESRLRVEQSRLREVDARLRHIEQERQQPRYEVVRRNVPAQLMATIRRVVPTQGQPITDLFDRLEAYVAQHRARAFQSPLMIFHDEDYRETDLEVEVAVPLVAAIPAAPDITVYELAGHTMASAVYTGSYERTSEVLNALLLWIEANRYVVAGPLREVYLRFGADNADTLKLPDAFLAMTQESFVTELQVPIKLQEE